MTREARFCATDALPATLDELSNGGEVVVLAPHPDDETLGCGQAIAALTDRGVRVQVIALTDGAASHRASLLYPPARLAALRAEELRRAVSVLGRGRAPEPVFLGYPDLAAPDDPATLDEAAGRIDAHLTPATRALWATWEGDPHPDHGRAARLAALVRRRRPRLRRWSYPVWGRLGEEAATLAGMAPGGALRRFDAPRYHARKADALAQHESQMTRLIPDDPDGFVMAQAHQRYFLAQPEVFIDER